MNSQLSWLNIEGRNVETMIYDMVIIDFLCLILLWQGSHAADVYFSAVQNATLILKPGGGRHWRSHGGRYYIENRVKKTYLLR